MYRSHSYSPPKVSSTEPSIPPRQFRKEDGTESRKEALEEISVQTSKGHSDAAWFPSPASAPVQPVVAKGETVIKLS